jgi:Dyp-type peroxidase family
LASLIPDIANDQSKPSDTAINIAFTLSGLKRLGVPTATLGMFSLEFQEGIATTHRSRLFSDEGESAPENWDWGGPTTPQVDVMLMVFARSEELLVSLCTDAAQKAEDHGLHEIARLDTYNLGGKEHFGFHDGISQPVIEGSSRSSMPMNTINAGEFVLGYLNEHGQYTQRPLLPREADPKHLLPKDPAGSGRADLGRNGTYLVFRTLRQDVPGFWRFMDGVTKQPDGSSNPRARTELAAKMVGRWPGGAPMATSPQRDDPHLSDFNDFGYYADDRYGLGCPIGAHVRRTNPRDSLSPGPGSEKSIQVGKRHRLIRRGREYGRPVDPGSLFDETGANGADDERGLHFICICGNIARQFEFIQHTWAMNPSFDGLYNGSDPLIGGAHEWDNIFTVPCQPVRHRTIQVPRFVTVRGGAYFFMPGMRALRYLSAMS